MKHSTAEASISSTFGCTLSPSPVCPSPPISSLSALQIKTCVSGEAGEICPTRSRGCSRSWSLIRIIRMEPVPGDKGATAEPPHQPIPRASPAPGHVQLHRILANVLPNVCEIMAGKKQTQLIFLNWSQGTENLLIPTAFLLLLCGCCGLER